MINEKEIEQVNLSATKKDFYQIWNELLEVAGKLSERWDPTSTNESDPGIVLLKVLTAIADKLNYQIDKNTLEAFMPSAAQEESMRKLCEMMGYSMKYYQSATTDVTITYIGEPDIEEYQITIPKYTNIKNADDDINYFTLEERILGGTTKTTSVTCMEGAVELCGDDTDNIISINQLDDNQRYYLPENQIAENGIFITNYNDTVESELWTKVDNLNTQKVGTQCYKFGYDSIDGRPYVQFPEDISAIIEDGLVIRYTRTNGANGNISARTLSVLSEPDGWSEADDTAGILSTDNFSVTNPSAAANGSNKESLNDAYNNYKKVIGTFDTLVTCRDYMNKIYQMTTDDANTTPLVSNIVVSDIRDDLNRAIVLCTFNDYGIAYEDRTLLDADATGDDQKRIKNFDLVLYPFTTITTDTPSKAEYSNSFQYSTANKNEIQTQLADNKTLSHHFVYPNGTELACIKNYLKLTAKITTTSKVNTIEEAVIRNNIFSAIYANFNARKLDFGDEIPFDSILEVIQNADTRIKNVALEEPVLTTKFCLADNNHTEYTIDGSPAIYNQLTLKNVLAGRVPLFDYNETFEPDYTDSKYTAGTGYDYIYGKKSDGSYIGKVATDFTISAQDTEVKLKENEIVQFRAPNFKTTTTYPAYINYLLHLNNADGTAAYPATFLTLRDYLDDTTGAWYSLLNTINTKNLLSTTTFNPASQTRDSAVAAQTKYGKLLTTIEGTISESSIWTIPTAAEWKAAGTAGTTYTVYFLEFSKNTFGAVQTWIKSQDSKQEVGSEYVKLKGLYRDLGVDTSKQPGYLIDINYIRYHSCSSYIVYDQPLNSYYVQETWKSSAAGKHTADGLGLDGTTGGIKADCDYELQIGEYLLINYTPSTTDSDGTTSTGTPVNKVIAPYTDDDGNTIKPVIRPNFDFADSSKYFDAGHTPSKTEGYVFDSSKYGVLSEVGGMFTLDSDQQIELREPIKVILNEASYIYWERLDEDKFAEVGETLTFNFDEDPIYKTGSETEIDYYQSYTLKDGEYFYYTDSSKLDLAYYGSGTKIIRANNSVEIQKTKQDSGVLSDDIANQGLLAAIPWEKIYLDKYNYLTIREYQYITLTEGDILKSLSTSDSSSAIGVELNSSAWQKNITSAEYKLSSDESTTTLPGIDISSISWEAKSILNLNVSPKIRQTLHTTGTTANNPLTKDSITLRYYKLSSTGNEEDAGEKEITPQYDTTNGWVDVSLKASTLCQSSNNLIDVHEYTYDENGAIDEQINEFGVKVFQYEAATYTMWTATGTPALSLKNYGDGHWTKVNYNNAKEFSLHIVLPSGNKGLMLVYNLEEDDDVSAYITVAGTGTTTPTLKICNASGSKFDANGWWANKHTEEKYYLRQKVNVIEIDGDCMLTVHSNSNKNGAIVFSNLDIVPYTTESNVDYLAINPRLCYQPITETYAIAQAFKDIRTIDTDYEFYYNAVIDNSVAIDLNTNIDIDETTWKETMKDPAIWYNYNNINNKFVISEISAEDLSKGITLTNSSRR